MKKILVAVVVVLALIFAAAIILPSVIDINAIVAAQIPKIENRIHRKVTIGRVKLTVLPGLGAEVKNVKISNNPDFRKQDFVSIDSLTATVRLLPLLKKQVMISSVSVEKPSVLIEKNIQGAFNFSDMIAAKEPAKEAEKKPQPRSEPANPLAALENIQISKISVKDGAFAFFDDSDAKVPKEIKLDKFNLILKAVSLSQKVSIDFDTDIYASPKAGHVSLSGDIGPIGKKLSPETIPVDLNLSLDNINLPELASYVKGIDIKSGAVSLKTKVKGRMQEKLFCQTNIIWDKLDMAIGDASKTDSQIQQLTVNGPWQIESDISGTAKTPTASGKVILDKSAIRFAKLLDKPADMPLNVDFDIAVREDSREFKKIIARIGSLEATVKGSVSKDNVLDVSLETNRFSTNKLVSLLPQAAESLPKELQLPDALQLSASANGTMDDLGFKATMDATDGKVVYGSLFQKDSGTPLSLNVSGRFKKDALRIDDLKLVLSKMALTADASIEHFAAPFIDGKAAMAPTPLDALAPILPPLKTYELQGTLELSDARFKGTIDELKNLKGVSGRLTIQNGSAVSAQLGRKIEKIQASVHMADQTLQVKNLSLDTFGGNLSSTAKVNMADIKSPQWSVDLTTKNINANAVLSQFTSMKDTFYGDFNSNLYLQGKGADWPSIQKTLSGNGSTNVANGKLANVNILDAASKSLTKFPGLAMLAQAVAPGAQQHLNETTFQELSAKFSIANEKILVESMTMSSPDFTLTGKGTIGLDKSLDLDTLLVLSKSASARFQQDKTMKYLLNKDERMEIPCAVKGDVSSPRVTVDGDTVNRLIQNAAAKGVGEQIQKGIEEKIIPKADKLLKQIFK